jgi:hypothetical protein
MGVATQNLVIQKTRNARGAYYSNVALKINVKLRGKNFVLGNAMPGIDTEPTIIMGLLSLFSLCVVFDRFIC